ncbi:MAG: 3,4-dihydroxy-2-butanone-4-phosphate synthase [Candidatus Micrarchaeota archaeon]
MLNRAISALKEGRFVVLYDGKDREGESDLVMHASYVTPEAIRTFRKDAGGLICFATSGEVMLRMRLDFLSDILRGSPKRQLNRLAVSRTPYGDKSAFSIAVNHRKTFTGITDKDRSLTINGLSDIISANKGLGEGLARNFYSPGHVPLLFSRGVESRRGHTELAVELTRLAKMPPAVVVCEMLGNGDALSPQRAKRYAKIHGIPFIEGKEMIGARTLFPI